MNVYMNKQEHCLLPSKGWGGGNPTCWAEVLRVDWTAALIGSYSHPHIVLLVYKHEDHFQRVSITFPFQHPGTDKQPLSIVWKKKITDFALSNFIEASRNHLYTHQTHRVTPMTPNSLAN